MIDVEEADAFERFKNNFDDFDFNGIDVQEADAFERFKNNFVSFSFKNNNNDGDNDNGNFGVNNVGGVGSNGNGAFPSTFFMWRITRRITRSLTQTNPSPRQRQQQRQVNRKPSKNTTGHRHTALAAVQRAATNSRPRPHPRHTPNCAAGVGPFVQWRKKCKQG